ncbi:MAG TPA: transglycosylase domain-containing protein [Alphaproteobacteria bacterium]|nr:transglycosylase domain-containing protein [Alphaproteobacteria bacterium]
MSPRRKDFLRLAIVLPLFCVLVVGAVTWASLQPVDESWRMAARDTAQPRVTDRGGQPLTASYHTRWNTSDIRALHDMPDLLVQAFLQSEDKRFYTHGGVDWRARGSALVQNIRARGTVRGASTVTEQVVRQLHPRPRSLWSKWLEGIEAAKLEKLASKPQILEFYLNQVPYASGRRGVAQAARYYFNRDVDTLSAKETLALAVLVRAPSGYDLYRDAARIDAAILRLADSLTSAGVLDGAARAHVAAQAFILQKPSLPVDAAHMVSYLRQHHASGGAAELQSTLDAGLQMRVQKIVDDRVRALKAKNLHNAAALVADYRTGEILAWVVAGAGDAQTSGGQIDAVTVPRQPGSALKPFLYAAALDAGWTASTIIDDSPYSGAVGAGLHRFRNYSNTFYGRITLREALGNSLNIPAVKTIRHVGVKNYLQTLHRLGFDSLARGAEVYDDGLALGNGEVTLLELVSGYAALASGGVQNPLHLLIDDPAPRGGARIYSEAAASLIGNILSDPHARQMEFGASSVLNFPLQTAVKTGTSTDYRDAWAVGYNDRYVAGIWMGNLDHRPTDGVTGGTGPALALRSVFSELNRGRTTEKLKISPQLVLRDVCIEDSRDAAHCYMRSEWFMPGAAAEEETTAAAAEAHYGILQPTEGLHMAIDPRVPMDMQEFAFRLSGLREGQAVEWFVNGESLGAPEAKTSHLWMLRRGQYKLHARITENGREVFATPEVGYVVK